MTRLLVATRSAHKLVEIRELLRDVPDLRLLDLHDADVPEVPEEAGIEVYGTFEENALAKARFFHDRSGLPTVADDSGLEVDALDGRPGVHSKRFAPAADDLDGEARDQANNEHLLKLLGDLPLANRTGRYVCVAALVGHDDEPALFRGEAEGLILGRAQGRGGFGYDPLFYDQGLGRTFGEISRQEKSRRSHRGAAFRALGDHLLGHEGESRKGRES